MKVWVLTLEGSLPTYVSAYSSKEKAVEAAEQMAPHDCKWTWSQRCGSLRGLMSSRKKMLLINVEEVEVL